LEDLRLNKHQGQLAEALRPGRRMGELAEATGLPVDEITRLLYALCILGVVVTSDALPKDLSGTGSFQRPVLSPPPPPVAPPAPVPAPPAASTVAVPTVPDPSPQELERRRNEIMQAYLSYRRQDAFDLLGVPEDGTQPIFDAKLLGFSRRFAPWEMDAADLSEKARDLFLAGARAYAELSDREQRDTLLFRRKTLREERARKPAASFAIKTDLLDAEAQYNKGKTLMDAGKVREALMLLEFAADCDPGNSLYAAELAYCRFLNTTAHADRAIKELQETLRRDPNCGIAAFYAGEIHRQAGSAEEAEAYLRRAIKLMSPDRRPIEALKALSTDRKR
jgi:tetratricopeptide (TPR) repeat protein